jgi:hypothetical protein
MWTLAPYMRARGQEELVLFSKQFCEMQMPQSINEPLDEQEKATMGLASQEPGTGLPSATGEQGGELLPDEIPFGLTRMEYRILCAGATNESQAGRNLFLGSLASALAGLAALVTEVDWTTAFRQARVAPFVWAALLFGIVLCSAGCAIVQHRHVNRDNRPYYALMSRLREYFEEEQKAQY